MIHVLMLACTFIVIGAAVNGISDALESTFLSEFLEQNLILILVALLAINTTTISVILTKMREIADRNPEANFSKTIKSMKQSSYEHFTLIGLAAIFQIAKGSTVICDDSSVAEFIFDSLLIAVFIYGIQILYDTARSVYVILDYGHK